MSLKDEKCPRYLNHPNHSIFFDRFAYMRNKHCVKSVRIQSYSGPHFPAFGYFLRSEISQLCYVLKE